MTFEEHYETHKAMSKLDAKLSALLSSMKRGEKITAKQIDALVDIRSFGKGGLAAVKNCLDEDFCRNTAPGISSRYFDPPDERMDKEFWKEAKQKWIGKKIGK